MMRSVLSLGLCLALVLCLACPAAAEEQITEEQQDRAVVSTVPGAYGMEVGAKAAIVMEVSTGRVLFAQDERERLPIASTTKIMTALLALEQPDPDAVFEVDSGAIHVEGSSMGLREGDQASLRALATGMLLLSGNDAANAAAVRISGNIPAFVALMNARARRIGMADTSFETPSGLDGDLHFSTAYDMGLLTLEALRNDQFVSICSQYKMRASFGDPPAERWLTNHNKLLGYYEGTFGVKTGFTKKAGRCLVSAARRDGIELLCVTLNCPDDWTTHQNLYDYYFARLELRDLGAELPPVAVPVTGGALAEVAAVRYDPSPVPVPIGETKLRCEYTLQPFLYAPVRQGQVVGEARVYLGEDLIQAISLVTDQDVALLHPYKEEKSLWERISGLFWDE